MHQHQLMHQLRQTDGYCTCGIFMTIAGRKTVSKMLNMLNLTGSGCNVVMSCLVFMEILGSRASSTAAPFSRVEAYLSDDV